VPNFLLYSWRVRCSSKPWVSLDRLSEMSETFLFFNRRSRFRTYDLRLVRASQRTVLLILLVFLSVLYQVLVIFYVKFYVKFLLFFKALMVTHRRRNFRSYHFKSALACFGLSTIQKLYNLIIQQESQSRHFGMTLPKK